MECLSLAVAVGSGLRQGNVPSPLFQSVRFQANGFQEVRRGSSTPLKTLSTPLRKNGYRKTQLKQGFKRLFLIPVLPLIGYFGLDATGVTGKITQHSVAMQRIVGEGFGHAGLCFSLHYVVGAGRHFMNAVKGEPAVEKKREEA